jgi:hypothetical protein
MNSALSLVFKRTAVVGWSGDRESGRHRGRAGLASASMTRANCTGHTGMGVGSRDDNRQMIRSILLPTVDSRPDRPTADRPTAVFFSNIYYMNNSCCYEIDYELSIRFDVRCRIDGLLRVSIHPLASTKRERGPRLSRQVGSVCRQPRPRPRGFRELGFDLHLYPLHHQ